MRNDAATPSVGGGGGVSADVTGSLVLALVSVGVCRGHALHDVIVGGDDVSGLPAVAVCVSGCLLLTERRCFQPDDHLLLEVVGE